MTARILVGDVRDVLATLPDASVQLVITSPPYWRLRSYMPSEHPNKALEIGSEATLAEYIAVIVDVFRHVRRVLRPDGCVFVNLGDAYAGGGNGGGGSFATDGIRTALPGTDKNVAHRHGKRGCDDTFKPKDLMMIPHRVAIALQEDGWWVRQDNVWAKANPMPESVTDRTTRSHEYVFHLSKSATYYYDAEAIREPAKKPYTMKMPDGWDTGEGAHGSFHRNGREKGDKQRGHERLHEGFAGRWDAMPKDEQQSMGANKRSVWHVATQGFSGAHYATYPEALITPCVLAGTSERGQCPACGAPWRRCMVREQIAMRPNSASNRGSNPSLRAALGNDQRGSMAVAVETTGWEPTCRCDAGPPVPQTVLDPFVGSGTTAVVALRHGRQCIGIDLDERNAVMARDRITGDAPLFNHVTIGDAA